MWLFYLGLLWVFTLEARQTVEITSESMRETRNGKEHAFIPWEGVKEIELVATIVAGAGLRVKENSCEIGVSNVDPTITQPMTLLEMHKAVGQASRMSAMLET